MKQRPPDEHRGVFFVILLRFTVKTGLKGWLVRPGALVIDLNNVAAESGKILMIELLKNVPLFSALSQEEFGKLQTICRQKHLKAGDVLFKEGDASDFIAVIQSGLVRITKGPDEAEIVILHPTEGLGELSFLDGLARSATATAVEDTEVLKIPSEKLRRLLESEASFSARFYKAAARYVTRRLRNTTEDLEFNKVVLTKHVKYF